MDSTICVSLTNHIHGNKFFNRKVFVPSVVQKTPSKDSEDPTDEEPAKSDNPCPNSLAASSDSDSASENDENATATKPPRSKLFTNISDQVKRPAQGSPEDLSGNKKNKTKKNKTNAAVRSSSRQGKTNKQQ